MIKAIKSPVTPVSDYPKLMVVTKGQNTGTVVLFSSNEEGTILIGTGVYGNREGYYSDEWPMEDFADYNEPITIQNA